MVDFVFIDSGTGGIPYLTYLLEKFPQAKCAYVGDTANFPYGEKTHEEIIKNLLNLCDKIIKKLNPSIIVIACNTMSVNSLDVLREAFPEVQFVGTVPAIKIAGEISKNRKIGLLATTSTVQHPYNQDLKNHFAGDCELISRADPELIAFIEHKSFTASLKEREDACRPAVEYFRQQGCDVIILGCTHFLNVASEMQNVAGQNIKIVDSKEGVVNRALTLYNSLNLQRQNQNEKQVPVLYITGNKDQEEYLKICQCFGLKFLTFS